MTKKEEVTTQRKFTFWKVLRGNGTTYRTSPKPISKEQALRRFRAIAVWGQEDIVKS